MVDKMGFAASISSTEREEEKVDNKEANELRESLTIEVFFPYTITAELAKRTTPAKKRVMEGQVIFMMNLKLRK
jgi:hypothetical protein